jgi:glycosyltransferase involved in cell wall biosynthesis
MSRVDVIVPCYNYGHYLRECVESVLSQEGVDVRVLIIDDCSPDNTPQVAAELMARDSRVEFRRHEKNIGHIATYNEGLEWATGEYLLLLSADDLVPSGAFARAVRLMNTHSEVVLAYGRCRIIHQHKPVQDDIPYSGQWTIELGANFLQSICNTGLNPIPSPAAAIVRTSVQKQHGGYLSQLTHSGDMEMWMRFALSGSIGFIDSCQGIYRKHVQNMSHDYYRHPQGDLLQRLEAYQAFFRNQSHRIQDPDRLEKLARKAVATDCFWSAHKSFDSGQLEDFRVCLSLAEQLHPEVRAWPEYRRLQWKRLMGSTLWSVFHPALRQIRRLAAKIV